MRILDDELSHYFIDCEGDIHYCMIENMEDIFWLPKLPVIPIYDLSTKYPTNINHQYWLNNLNSK